jgi:hypothetical protein
MGLTTFPKKRLKANQALLSGANAVGKQIVNKANRIAKNAERIVHPRESFS